VPPGIGQAAAQITRPSPWNRRSGAPFVFDVHFREGDSAGVPVHVWRYQLHFDERDLFDIDSPQTQPHTTDQDGSWHHAASSRVEVLERFTITSPRLYYLLPNASSPCVPCDPREVPSRYFFQEKGNILQFVDSTVQDSNGAQDRGTLLVQYTTPSERMPGISTGVDGGESSSQGVVTTIVETSEDKGQISGYCPFSGRVVYSRVTLLAWQPHVINWSQLLVDVTLYDFLN